MVRMNEQSPMFLPINSYGVIGDCRTVVFVGPDGSIDWGCLPTFGSPALFCRLLDAQQGGYFQIAPIGKIITSTQHYLHDSNVLYTTFCGETGEAVLTDFMPVATVDDRPFHILNKHTWPFEDDTHQCLVRKVECLQGEIALTLRLKVMSPYAAAPAEMTLLPDTIGALLNCGEYYAGLSIAGASDITAFDLSNAGQEAGQQPTLLAHMTLHEGERIIFALGVERSFSEARRLVEMELGQRNFENELVQTLVCWRNWVSAYKYHGPYSEWMRRSALTFKMFAYAATGTVVASPITSLLEEQDFFYSLGKSVCLPL